MKPINNENEKELTAYNVHCFECGEKDNNASIRHGLCLDCYCRELNVFLIPADRSQSIGFDAAQKKAHEVIDQMQSDKRRKNFANGYGKKTKRGK